VPALAEFDADCAHYAERHAALLRAQAEVTVPRRHVCFVCGRTNRAALAGQARARDVQAQLAAAQRQLEEQARQFEAETRALKARLAEASAPAPKRAKVAAAPAPKGPALDDQEDEEEEEHDEEDAPPLAVPPHRRPAPPAPPPAPPAPRPVARPTALPPPPRVLPPPPRPLAAPRPPLPPLDISAISHASSTGSASNSLLAARRAGVVGPPVMARPSPLASVARAFTQPRLKSASGAK
jgi:hypothetical protein